MHVHHLGFIAFALAGETAGLLQRWECVKNRPCSIQLSSDNVTTEDIILVDDQTADEDGACPVCSETSRGLCPWLTGDSGIDDTVMCEDGSFTTQWACQLYGSGDRVLCPPNTVLCANRACGGGLDFCCESQAPDEATTCLMNGGPRGCPYLDLTAGLAAVLNTTHGSTRTGMHSICRCGPEHFLNRTPGMRLGSLNIVGPSDSQTHVCASGTAECSIQDLGGIESVSTTSLVQVTTAKTCYSADVETPESFIESFRFRWNVAWSGLYLHGAGESVAAQRWLAAQSPGVYTLCWCNNDTAGVCQSISDFNVSVGHLALRGPNKQQTRMVTIGEDLELPVSGVWISTSSIVRIQPSCGDSPVQRSLKSESVNSTSAELIYSFGLVTEDQLPPGTYSLCWCEPEYSAIPAITCSSPADFVTSISDVYVRCPAGQFSANDGPCTSCAMFWEEPNTWRNQCLADALNLGAVVGILTCYFIGWIVLWYQVGILTTNDSQGCRCLGLSGRKVHLEDITSSLSKNGDSLATITTRGRHFLSARFGAFPIYFYQTGHYMLDRRPEARKFLYSARPLGPRRLQLLDETGKPVGEAETSRGYFVLPFIRCVLHSDVVCDGLPAVIVAPILILCSPPLLLMAHLDHQVPYSLEGGVATMLLGCLLGFLISRVLKYFLQRWSPIHFSIAAFQKKLSERQYVPAACERGPDRALTAWQIFELMSEFKQYIRDRNLYYIDSNIIHPLTRQCQLSLAELLGPSKVQWFVSHFWGTSFAYTCDALRRHAENAAKQSGTTWQSVSYWICAFSNNQYRIQEELGATHKESSFFHALHSSCVHGTCMVLDEKALPLTRSWCLFELLQTMNLEKERKDFQGLQFCTNTGVVNLGQATTEVAINIGRRLAVLSLADAKATRAKDHDTIRSLVIQEMGGFEQIDSKLRMQIRDALMVCKQATECSFNVLCDRLEGTGHRSVSLIQLTSLSL